MITPHFELTQDTDFVVVRIRLPHLKVDAGELCVIGCEFKFHLRPYFLRLTFRHPLVEDGRERAVNDISSGVLTVWLPKETPGLHFEGLDMLTELLRRPSARARPLIQVMDTSEQPGDQEDEAEGEDEDEDDVGWLAEAEQQAPPLLTSGSAVSYGFNAAYAGVFAGLEEEEVLQLPLPEATDTGGRRSGRMAAEEAAFDVEHYIADFMEDDLAQAAIAFEPWWAGAAASEDAGSAGSAGGPGSACFGIGSEHQAALLQLPRKEFLLNTAARRRALCGLVDLLFAYAYDTRTTEGEPTVESGWTVCRLSSLLSWFDTFDSVVAAGLACVRRSLAYPLVRHLRLAHVVLADVGRLLRLGRPAVLRCLLEARAAIQSCCEHGYLLNRVWLDDYCVWLQQLHPRWLTKLSEKLDAVEVTQDMVGWPLAAYEAVAQEGEGEDGIGVTKIMGT